MCGDGHIDTPNNLNINEVCDDGNIFNGDRCAADCSVSCQNGFIYDGRVCSDYTISNSISIQNGSESVVLETPVPTSISTPIPLPTGKPAQVIKPTQTYSPSPRIVNTKVMTISQLQPTVKSPRLPPTPTVRRIDTNTSANIKTSLSPKATIQVHNPKTIIIDIPQKKHTTTQEPMLLYFLISLTILSGMLTFYLFIK